MLSSKFYLPVLAGSLICASAQASVINGTLQNGFATRDLSVTTLLGGNEEDMNSIPDVVDWTYWRAFEGSVAFGTVIDGVTIGTFDPPPQSMAYTAISKNAGIIDNDNVNITKSNDNRNYRWWSKSGTTFVSSSTATKHNAGWFFSDGDGPVFTQETNDEGELVDVPVEPDEDRGKLGATFARRNGGSTNEITTTLSLDAGSYSVYLFIDVNAVLVDLTATLDDGATASVTAPIITNGEGATIKGKQVWQLDVDSDSSQTLALSLFGQGIDLTASSFNLDGIVVTQGAAVPEPASLALIGLGGLVALGRRR
ncbi:PEP-CTERM sorting domain-containing protein [Poriferisphaera sp. WC338]|uniref:PEP-CTERM sorting domain-containing protein n=1 Tax=Poriferisphaera sp. WC338 TaxID=3425129 RepID=UPI003D81BF7E